MPASQASTAWIDPLPPLRGPPPPASGGRQGFGLIAPLLHVFLAHPHLGGWVASGVRRKGASIFFLPTPTWGVGGERSETEGGIHLFLAHPHSGGGWRAQRDGRGHPCFLAPHSGGGWRAERDGRGHQCNGAPFYSGCPFFTRCD